MISDVLHDAASKIEAYLATDGGYEGGVMDEVRAVLREMDALRARLDNPNTVWPARAAAPDCPGPEIFDDPRAMACRCLDMDVADSASEMLHIGIDIDNRAAVERFPTVRDRFLTNPETRRRFIDAVVSSARYQRDHAHDVQISF